MKKKPALLIATDDWRKMDVFMRHLSKNSKAVWRNKLKYSDEFLDKIHCPINIYFFHRNIIKFKGRCVGIYNGTNKNWSLKDSPEEYRSNQESYTNAIYLDKLERVKDTHISSFPKWDDSSTSFNQGQLGLLRVEDISD